MEIKKELNDLKKDVEDLKALFIIFLQKLEVDNKKIADAIGMSSGRVSQMINKNKYPRK